ncbi:MAG: outer membrane protein assembly factor BamA, partial [Azoarcus sp.]|nr:outer membrane protein assembly factor BamA [Azoarcus sp.]
EIFSRERLTETTKAISDRLGNEGYAFANINAAPEIDAQKREVAFTIYVDPGRKVYVRRVNVQGNTKTRDEVIRREVRQMESAWYDGAAINRSRDRIDRLGFFDEVTVETPAVTGATDQVDVNFTVKERRTGSLMLGLGYSSAEKAILQASISERNLFGSGRNATIAFDTSRSGRTLALSVVDPYFTADGVSLGGDVYYRTYDPSRTMSVSPYKMISTGAGINLGYPIAENDNVSMGLGFDRTRIQTYKESYRQYKDFCKDFDCHGGADAKDGIGKADVNSLLVNLGWAHDSRNSYLYPTKGNYQRLYGEVATPPADLRYWKATYQFQHWIPVGETAALMFNSEFGWIKGYAHKPVPFYKNFYVGGIGSVRGYDSSSLGSRDEDGNATGGTRKFVANLEFFFPSATRDRSFRISTFVDAGYVWGKNTEKTPATNPHYGEQQRIRGSDLRYSAGVGVTWNAPIGPLKFSLGYPLNRKKGDKIRPFDFVLGATF